MKITKFPVRSKKKQIIVNPNLGSDLQWRIINTVHHLGYIQLHKFDDTHVIDNQLVQIYGTKQSNKFKSV